MTMTINLRHPVERRLRNSAPLSGKRLIGRGTYAAVFEGSRPDTVYKLTTDKSTVDLALSWARQQKEESGNPHFPKIYTKPHVVGELKDGNPYLLYTKPHVVGELKGLRKTPIYLMEMERLELAKIPATRLAISKVIRTADNIYWTNPGAWQQSRWRVEFFRELSEQQPERTLKAALLYLADFCKEHKCAKPDLHRRNIMFRGETLVLVDPVWG